MSTHTATPLVTTFATYRNPEIAKYPFCPGCGHSTINDQLNAALVKLQLDPHKVVIVTDIGCVGLSDQYFAAHAFHGLHGRSVAYASGIKLANPELKVIVLMGDGGCGIGGHHLINAARRNVGITVLVFNNLNFGMTGGQHSVTTPHGALTATTRGGNLERPLDICATVGVNGASYVYRGTSFDKDLPERIAEAINVDGFALMDLWELCTAYYVPNNDFSRSDMLGVMSELHMQAGELYRAGYPELASAYRAQYAPTRSKTPFTRKPLAREFTTRLDKPLRVVIAGSAGGKVKSTATVFAQAAIRCGLFATQRDDYPTTVMSGHSLSEIIIAPGEIFYTGIPRPDVLAIISPEGLGQVKAQLAEMGESGTVYVLAELESKVQTRARKIILRPDGKTNRKALAMMAVAAFVKHSRCMPLEALTASVRADQRADVAEESLKAIETGIKLVE
ncbi:MAG: 2-oxoacid:acceptor oxidoreductase family protein [Chloroflexi bacterium]|nr:2-oxoacid:acceptor oxidoreductase family protein [Chloroflexota bacterium]